MSLRWFGFLFLLTVFDGHLLWCSLLVIQMFNSWKFAQFIFHFSATLSYKLSVLLLHCKLRTHLCVISKKWRLASWCTSVLSSVLVLSLSIFCITQIKDWHEDKLWHLQMLSIVPTLSPKSKAKLKLRADYRAPSRCRRAMCRHSLLLPTGCPPDGWEWEWQQPVMLLTVLMENTMMLLSVWGSTVSVVSMC